LITSRIVLQEKDATGVGEVRSMAAELAADVFLVAEVATTVARVTRESARLGQ